MSSDKAKAYECRIDIGGNSGTIYVVAESAADARRKVAWMFPLCNFSIRGECDV